MKFKSEEKRFFFDGSIAFTVLFLLIVNYICLGFYKNGIDSPLSYSGGDAYMESLLVKTITERGWVGGNTFVGAPFKMTFYDFQPFFLQNTENVGTFIITRFIKSSFAAFNIQFLFSIVLCGVTSFLVLSYLGVRHLIASVGAILYGMSPYIYLRGMGHFGLAACYFVPLSILLCVFAMEDDDVYLSFRNGVKAFFHHKKNIAAIIFSILIANNGIGYYPFFTCFFLCVTALLKLFRTKKLSSLRASVMPICLIVFFMLVALMPVFMYKMSVGSNNITARSIFHLEVYSLKPTQFFMPTNKYHTEFIRNLTAVYNSRAPLVNENRFSYLGVFGCVGFILIMILAFVPEYGKSNMTNTLFPKLSLWAIVFFCVGGLTSYLCLLTGFRSIRSFNRVSIFIEFMAIATLCGGFQHLLDMVAAKKNRALLWTLRIFICLFSLLCIYEQHPSRTINNEARSVNKAKREYDKVFVRQIEGLLRENDAVFQLPYHKFPESGPVRKMPDYGLFAGYINSTKLRWSYGGMKGRESDIWNERVSSLPMERLVPAIVQSGFRGIYIDSRAYTEDELTALRKNIESVLIDEKPLVSGDATLYFYNLYPYIGLHQELLNLPIFDVYFPVYLSEKIFLYGQEKSREYFLSGLSYQEESFTWTSGKSLVMLAKLQDCDKSLPVHVAIDCNVFNGVQRVNVVVNKTKRIKLTAGDGAPLEFDFMPPKDGRTLLEFEFPDAVSPKKLGLSEDSRNLALALKTIVFTQNH